MHPYVFDKTHGTGKTLLITAGVDGDEYAGIEAAYRLIERYKKQEFTGRLIIVPIVNLAGFQNETSWNPEDNKYPKLVGIGKSNGSASDRLMHWLISTYAVYADVWLDMHGGSITEVITPFVSSWKTGNTEVDALSAYVLSVLSVPYVLRAQTKLFGSARYLAKHGCAYLLTESGERGERRKDAIGKHTEWVEIAMKAVGMIEGVANPHEKTVFTHMRTYETKYDGRWYPAYVRPRNMKKGEVLGVVRSYEGKILEEIKAKEDCLMLWGKVTATAKKGETLIGVGF